MDPSSNGNAQALSVPAAAMPRRVAPVRRTGARSFAVLAVTLAIAGWIALLQMTESERAVLTPAFVILSVSLLFVVVLYLRDRKLPVFDGGMLFVAATTVYSVSPLIQYWLMGMVFTPFSDLRFYTYQPTPAEFGGFAWRHVVLITTFAVVYLMARGRGVPAAPVRPSTPTGVAVFIVLTGTVLYFAALRMYTGEIKSVYEGGTGQEIRAMVPHVIIQISNVLLLMRFTLKQCLIVFLMSRWHQLRWRIALFAWIGFEVASTVIERGPRGQAALLVLTVVVVYHRLVKPLRPMLAFAGAAAILTGFLVLGMLRDFHRSPEDRATAYSVNNEFQGLFANAYDLHTRKQQNTLPPIPPQLYYSDLYALIPSQLLPFFKADPSNWYIGVMEAKGTGMGFMFGFLAQTTIGFDWPDIVVRAALLALFYAFLIRFYRSNASSYWATMFYLFTLTWAYYAFRSTSFDILYKIVYYFVPTFVVVSVLRFVITKQVSVARKALSR